MSDPLHSHSGSSQPRSGDPQHDFPVFEGYDVIDLIGRGGMGAVYEAFQQSTGRRVAVKLMIERANSTDSAKRRFEREVELIARLNHPGIVSVLDSGLHRSRYFYVMEHVEGKALDEALPPGVCEIRAALRVIVQVARAVDYAHQRGVMHRDLKPGNILIDERGEPRLLDFGLAKAFDPNSLVNFRDSLSEPGQVIGTLGYMSPEQARGAVAEVSVRSDVYSLGAIAYEMVSGVLPCAIDGAMALVFHRIENRDPDRPSLKRKGVSADVDAVLLKALEKSPSKRYATAGAFADDLEKCLAGRTVTARRVGAIARAVRWCRRNPAPAATMVALVLLAASLGAALYLRSAREQAVATTRSMLESMMASVETFDPDKGPGMARAAMPLLERMENTLREVTLPPDFVAFWCEQIGEQHHKWEKYDRALECQSRAVELQRSLHAGPHEDVARCLRHVGGAYYFLRRLTEAEEYCRESLVMRQGVHADDPNSPEVADSMNFLAQTLGLMRRFEEAEALQKKAIEMLRQARFDQDPLNAVAARNNYATLRLLQGDFSGAEAIYREALARLLALPSEKFRRHAATSRRNIAECMIEQGRLDGVDWELDDAETIAREYYGANHPRVAAVAHVRAWLRLEQGRVDEAERLGRQALAIRVVWRGESHAEVAATRLLLGRILVAAGRVVEGEGEIRAALAIRRTAQPILPLDVAEAEKYLGDALMAQERSPEAFKAYSSALPILSRDRGPEHTLTKACIAGLARAKSDSGVTKSDGAIGRN